MLQGKITGVPTVQYDGERFDHWQTTFWTLMAGYDRSRFLATPLDEVQPLKAEKDDPQAVAAANNKTYSSLYLSLPQKKQKLITKYGPMKNKNVARTYEAWVEIAKSAEEVTMESKWDVEDQWKQLKLGNPTAGKWKSDMEALQTEIDSVSDKLERQYQAPTSPEEKCKLLLTGALTGDYKVAIQIQMNEIKKLDQIEETHWDALKATFLAEAGRKDRDGEQPEQARYHKAFTATSKTDRDTRRCFKCNEVGHIKPNCPKKQGNPENAKSKGGKDREACRNFKKGRCNRGANCRFSHDNVADNKKPSEAGFVVCSFPVVKMSMATTKNLKTKLWGLDTFATSHMTPFEETLEDRKNTVAKILAANGITTATVAGKCILRSSFSGNLVRLEDVLLVKTLPFPLVSAKRLFKAGLRAGIQEHDPNYGKITDSAGQVICDITFIDGLPFLDMETLGGSTSPTPQISLPTVDLCDHTRFGHRSNEALERLKRVGAWSRPSSGCEVCAKGKQAKKKLPGTGRKPASKPLEKTHADLGSFSEPTIGGATAWMGLVDDKTRFKTAYLLKTKSSNETIGAVSRYKKLNEKRLQPLKMMEFQADGGSNFTAETTIDWLESDGIEFHQTPRGDAAYNGVAERFQRSCKEMARCMLLQGNLPGKFAGAAICYATDLLNMTTCPPDDPDKTCYEAWHGRKPYVGKDKILPFGCQAYAVKMDANRQPIAAERSDTCVFIGRHQHTGKAQLYNLKTGRVVNSRHVKAFPDIFPFANPSSEEAQPCQYDDFFSDDEPLPRVETDADESDRRRKQRRRAKRALKTRRLKKARLKKKQKTRRRRVLTMTWSTRTTKGSQPYAGFPSTGGGK